MLLSALAYSHALMNQTIQPGDTVIDATVGNGHDTHLLARLVKDTGKVIGFDIQKQAIDTTKRRLIEAGLDQRVQLHPIGHENIVDILPPAETVSLVVYNLGYLPKGDKSIITTPGSTLSSVKQALSRLKKNGLVLLMVYYGHQGGEEEKDVILDYVESLPQKNYSVLHYNFLNQKNSPPFLIAIEKK
ncbi:Putative rRNA methylase [Alkalibacterium putridalgicola]|uniref:Putative rRNA methylase n=1 Tax=Alkalibacterium putridalgicola TaxID=426703 RepID=A0A1H7SEQ4_9LACT|nr:class I SAM-dependent methyltransferase [Alkalibacterium putridalgicola]GEK88778.1 rRNA methyltransferase [Alkalibacterium putridalgicola]SEL70975.1 Putative rRNA methylase [Alkalibacterium putridalgicola]